MRERRKKPQHQANHERWLVSYADFITLLFAFFVVLYSSAQVDQRRVGQLSYAIQMAFQQMGVFDSPSSRPVALSSNPSPLSNVRLDEETERLKKLGRIGDTTVTQPFAIGTKGAVQQQLEKALAPEIQNNVVAVRATKDGIVVSLRERGFFDSGSPYLKPEAEAAIAQFVKVVRPLQQHIRIEGHTDDVPIHTARFDSNWELSTARATEMIKLFISQYDLAPERLSASGYGEYYPVASNETAAGRAINRRVDLVILNSPPDAAGSASGSPAPLPPSSRDLPSSAAQPRAN